MIAHIRFAKMVENENNFRNAACQLSGDLQLVVPDAQIESEPELREKLHPRNKFRPQAELLVRFSLQVSPDATKAVEQTMAGSAPTANPAWEASGPSVAGGFTAVKKDVLLRIESFGLKQEQKEKVLAQAMTKI